MEVKQHTIGAFFIQAQEEDLLVHYIDKNAPLLKGHLLVFQGTLSNSIKQRLEHWGLCFVTDACQFKRRGKKKSQEPDIKPLEDEKTAADIEIITEDIRSGREIHHLGDLVIQGRVKDGASIHTEGTLCVFGIIEGDISCNGAYLMLRRCKRGKVLFQGTDVKPLLEGEALKMIYKEHEEIKIKELE